MLKRLATGASWAAIRVGLPVAALALAVAFGVGFSAADLAHGGHKVLTSARATAPTTTIAPTTTVPATTTTVLPPPVTTTAAPPPREIIVQVPATTAPTTIPPPPPCQAGGMLLIPGTDLVPTTLDAVGTVYWETEAAVAAPGYIVPGPATFDSAPGLCTYVSPPKGMAVVCPANDPGVELPDFGFPGNSLSLPATLWAPLEYNFSQAPTLLPCTYAGWNWRPGTTAHG
jgi:hypothetical protein